MRDISKNLFNVSYYVIKILIETAESLFFIIVAVQRRSITDKSIKHHGGIHQGIIIRGSFLEIRQHLYLGGRYKTFTHPNPFTMPAVCAMTVHGNIAIGTCHRNPVLFFIPLKWQCLHGEKVFRHLIS
jgi:hypothetical protein